MTGRTLSDRVLYMRLLAETRPYALHLVVVFVLGLLSAPLAMLAPLPLKIAVDSALGSHPLPPALRFEGLPPSREMALVVAVGVLVAVTLAKQLQDLATRLLRAYVLERLVLDLRGRLFLHAQRLSLSHHDRQGTTDATYRIHRDVPDAQSIVVESLFPSISAVISLAGMLVVTARIDWQLALVAIAIVPGLFLMNQYYRRGFRGRSREVRNLETSALGIVQEAFGALRVVKAFGQERREQERFVRRSRQGMSARLRLTLAEGGFGVWVGLLTVIGTSLVLFVGVRHVQSGTLTLGALLMVMGYLTQLYDPLKTLSRRTSGMQAKLTSAERVFTVLDGAEGVAERPNARPLLRARGQIEFDHVSFGYDDDRIALHDVSFQVPAGTRVGIAGPTGAGKTTLVNLLMRLYDPSEGRVLLDGVDVRDIRIDDLRRQFAMVLQEPVLFSTTVGENIAYARPEAGREQIEAAARAANAHDFIVALPQGYDTPVGERGMTLSGGERQRVSLARAFLKDAPILVLDEPTSAVDLRSEALIMEALERLMHGRTTLMVAHRLSTLEGCELRLELDRGRLLAVRPSESAGARVEAARTPARDPRPPANGVDPGALDAWRRLAPGRSDSGRIEVVRNSRHKARAIYRLTGVEEEGGAVIAKKCPATTGWIERTIYERILPRLPVTAPRFHGFAEEGADNGALFGWLFIEDVGRERLSPDREDHRALAARWLAAMHTSAACVEDAARLPDRGPSHYLKLMRSARSTILRQPQGAPSRERAVLEQVLRQCDALEAGWARVETCCEGVPATLVHGDFRRKNVYVRTAGSGGPGLFPIDWETAGWGVPAADLAPSRSRYAGHLDLEAYGSIVRTHWPAMELPSLPRLVDAGTVFRRLAGIYWASLSLGSAGNEDGIDLLDGYRTELAPILTRLSIRSAS